MLLLALLVTSVPAYGETNFYVALGSYADQETAEQAGREASQRLPEPYTVQGAQTGIGYMYRVLAGPYMTRELAEQTVAEARQLGFADAWLLASQDDDLALPRVYADDLLGEEALEQSRSTDSAASSDVYRTEAGTVRQPRGPTSPGAATPPSERGSATPPAPVSEPPEGYKLHKLHREAHGPPIRADQPILVAGVLSGDTIPIPFLASARNQITIDGIIDEAAWTNAHQVTDFRVIEPDTLVPGSRYPTTLSMLFSEDGLYLAYDMEQPVETLLERQGSRDDGRLNRDSVAVTLDTSGNGRYGYWFQVALGDGQTDGTIKPEREFSRDWDGVWFARTRRTTRGWSAEFMIPWSQMSMPTQTGDRSIGIYTSRRISFQDERHAWPALPETQPRFMSVLQALQFDGVNPRQQWSVFPYASVTADQVGDETNYKAGADMYWRPSPNVQVTATLNPDFGNVESDDVDVNLTAFETFFGEKRLFFQQEQDIFVTTPRADPFANNEPTTLLNTRRIGGPARDPELPPGVELSIIEDNKPTEVAGALKLTGQSGSLRFGALAALEEDTRFVYESGLNSGVTRQDGRDFGALRVLYESRAPGDSYKAIGLLSTLVAHPEEDAQVNGVDYHYLAASGRWKVDGQFMNSDKDSVGDGFGGFADVVYTPSQGLRYKLSLSHYDDKLDINDFGFLRRNDVSQASIRWEYSSAAYDWARFVEFSSFYNHEVNGDGLRVRDGLFFFADATLNNLFEVDGKVAWFPSRFEDRASFGNGTFRIDDRPSLEFGINTDGSKPLLLRLAASYEGEFVDGARKMVGARLVWRPVDRLNLSLQVDHIWRDAWTLHQEDRNFTSFETEEWRPRLTFDFFASARQQLRVSFQWIGIRAEEDRFFVVPDRAGELIEVSKPAGPTDDFTISNVNLQVRYRWEIAPLSDLFVVYTRSGLQTPTSAGFDDLLDDSFGEPLGEQLVVKLRYRFGS